jgi:hypothetical protein
MHSLERSLQDYPAAMLRAIAEINGIDLSSNIVRQMAGQIATVLSDSAQLTEIMADCSAQAQLAMDDLLRARGSILLAAFERNYGTIRLVGPAQIERRQPHRSAASPAEELWYRGLIYRAFAETPDGSAEFIYVPDDLAVLLPIPRLLVPQLRLPAAGSPGELGPALAPVVHDACSLLCLVQTGRVKLRHPGNPMAWRSNHLYELNRLLLQPVEEPGTMTQSRSSTPAALVLILAVERGWVRAVGTGLRLDGRAVQPWLDSPRGEQQRALLEGWRSSTLWNDLWRVPALWCEDTGGWANDPVATRERLIALLASLEAGTWYRLADLVAGVKQALPDFQRPDGNYSTWYLRRRDAQAYLSGFESWDAVEGELLRYLFTDPWHWLGAVDLAADGAGGDSSAPSRFRLTPAGAAWLAGEPAPPERAEGRLVVSSDFGILVPGDAALRDRFRVARFTSWTPGGPPFRYRITQSGLRRAASQGIPMEQVLAFLEDRSDGRVPANVLRALQRWDLAGNPGSWQAQP